MNFSTAARYFIVDHCPSSVNAGFLTSSVPNDPAVSAFALHILPRLGFQTAAHNGWVHRRWSQTPQVQIQLSHILLCELGHVTSDFCLRFLTRTAKVTCLREPGNYRRQLSAEQSWRMRNAHAQMLAIIVILISELVRVICFIFNDNILLIFGCFSMEIGIHLKSYR